MAVFRRHPADLYLLQEVTPQWDRHLRNLNLGTARAVRPHRGTHGFAIIARRGRIHDVKYLTHRGGRPFAQCALVSGLGPDMRVCNVHFASPAKAVEDPPRFVSHFERSAARRAAQWTELDAYLRRQSVARVLIGGDVNTIELEPLYDRMQAGYQDVFRQTHLGLGATFPNMVPGLRPVLRLDYVLVRGPWAPIKAEVLAKGGSDHWPIWAELVGTEHQL